MHFNENKLIARSLENKFDVAQCSSSELVENENSRLNDPSLELSDPTPNIHDLFVKFDHKFFWGTLGMVQVLWSKRMTKCAGLCYFEGNGGLCKISLSAPLLSLRPRKDLVETLLHEMIHAYLFVTNNHKDREDHGVEFRKHMNRINQTAGTNITVYHTFHDEVDYYQRHIWRCTGPCQFKKPYFGFVKRAMNRAPGPNDTWWMQHQMECTGTFIKISEPEKRQKNAVRVKSGKGVEQCKDIRDYFEQQPVFEKISLHKNLLNDLISIPKENSTLKDAPYNVSSYDASEISTMSTSTKVSNNCPSNFKMVNSKSNIKKNKEINDEDQMVAKKSSDFNSGFTNFKDPSKETVRDFVRSFWSNKFDSKLSNAVECGTKKIKLAPSMQAENIDHSIDLDISVKKENIGRQECEKFHLCPVCSEKILSSELQDHLDECLSSVIGHEKPIEGGNGIDELVSCPCCSKWFFEEIINSHIDECLTMIALKKELFQ